MTISISDEFEAIQMVSELVTGWCAKEDVGLQEVNCEILKGKIKKNNLLAVDLEYYK